MNNEPKNFYAIIYVKENVLRTRFIREDEYKNRYDVENRGYFLIQTETNHFSAIEEAMQQLERLVKIIYRRHFLFGRYLSDEQNCLITSIKEVENVYTERQKQYIEQGI